MNKFISLCFGGLKTSIHSWWDSKTLTEQKEIELVAAILGPSIGSVFGMLIVF